MKNSRGIHGRVLTGLVFAFLDLVVSLVWAQETGIYSVKPDHSAGLVLVAPKKLPESGAFWSLQRPDRPPLPFNPFPGLPVYWRNKDYHAFLVDDRSVDYEALHKQWLAMRMLEAAALGMSLAEMESLENGGVAAYSYSTDDLWLEITAFTNHTAALVIHAPPNLSGAILDLFYATNLSSPVNWRFLTRIAATNVLVPVLVPDLCDAQGYFRVGQTNGALTLTSNVPPQEMAQLIVPPWVTVANATYTGVPVASGTFAGGHGCGLPLESGAILSSGDIGLAVGPNDVEYATLDNDAYSDPDLDNLVGGSANTNAAVLEFDIVSSNSFALQFQYIFASEEYPEYMRTYTDPMAIFVSTNRVGANWIITSNNNIAVVPVTHQPVSVSTINGGDPPSNPQYYVDNPPYQALFNVQYDGMTVLLNARIQVWANATNHIKIAIEDFGDRVRDSAVFIKAWEPGECCQCQ